MARLSNSVPPYSTFATYLEEINRTQLLQADEEHVLASRVCNQDLEARDQLVRANLRLVVFIAREFRNRGLSLEDLIQEGNLGLIRAAEGFDPNMGTRVSTYASHWIRQAMQRALDNMVLPIRVPSYAIDLVTKWRRTVTQLTDENRRTPSREEVAATLNLSKRQTAVIEKALCVYHGNAVRQKESYESVEENLQDPGNSAETEACATEEIGQMIGLIDSLCVREAKILRLRFGLSGEDPLNLSQIGLRLGLTRERVRQLETLALQKLRDRMTDQPSRIGSARSPNIKGYRLDFDSDRQST